MTVLCLVSKEKGYYKRKSEGDGLHFVSGYGRSSDRRGVVQTHILPQYVQWNWELEHPLHHEYSTVFYNPR